MPVSTSSVAVGARGRPSSPRPALLSAALLTWTVSIMSATTLAGAPSPDDTYLDDLRGPWIMQGTFGNKAFRYEAVGKRVLRSGWLQIHMVDAAKPSKYRAEVFLGYDAAAGDFIVHWLDTWGAAGARVVATGHRDGERLVVVFPYAAGTLRDTFERDRSSGTCAGGVAGERWHLVDVRQLPAYAPDKTEDPTPQLNRWSGGDTKPRQPLSRVDVSSWPPAAGSSCDSCSHGLGPQSQSTTGRSISF